MRKINIFPSQDIVSKGDFAEQKNMQATSRLTRNIVMGMLVSVIGLGIGLGVAFTMLPPGTRIQDIPKILADYRRQASHPTTQKLLDMLLSDEQLALLVHGTNPDANPISAGAGIGDQTEIGRSTVVTTAGPVYDPKVLDRLEKMNISTELKKEIKRHYLRTGELPGVRLTETADTKTKSQIENFDQDATSQRERQAGRRRAATAAQTQTDKLPLSAAVKKTLMATATDFHTSNSDQNEAMMPNADNDRAYQYAYARLLESIPTNQDQDQDQDQSKAALISQQAR